MSARSRAHPWFRTNETAEFGPCAICPPGACILRPEWPRVFFVWPQGAAFDDAPVFEAKKP